MHSFSPPPRPPLPPFPPFPPCAPAPVVAPNITVAPLSADVTAKLAKLDKLTKAKCDVWVLPAFIAAAALDVVLFIVLLVTCCRRGPSSAYVANKPLTSVAQPAYSYITGLPPGAQQPGAPGLPREPPPKIALPPKLAEVLGVRDAPAATNGARGREPEQPVLRGSVYTTQLTAGQKQQGGAYGEV